PEDAGRHLVAHRLQLSQVGDDGCKILIGEVLKELSGHDRRKQTTVSTDTFPDGPPNLLVASVSDAGFPIRREVRGVGREGGQLEGEAASKFRPGAGGSHRGMTVSTGHDGVYKIGPTLQGIFRLGSDCAYSDTNCNHSRRAQLPQPRPPPICGYLVKRLSQQ